MKSTKSAIRYAKAILEMSQANNNTVHVAKDMISIGNAVKESKELKDFLLNPTVIGNVKLNALLEVFASAQNETKSLFQTGNVVRQGFDFLVIQFGCDLAHLQAVEANAVTKLGELRHGVIGVLA